MTDKPERDALKAPPVPCGSCPYRMDVPSGIWAKHEYDKLPAYDGETWEQSPAAFMCHQRDGHLCGGWLACHDPRHLLALRFERNLDPSVFDYTTDVPVFESGAAARAHGIKDIKRPKARARNMVAGLMKKQERETKLTLAERRALTAVAAGQVTNRFDTDGNVFECPDGISPRVCRRLQQMRLIEDVPRARHGDRFHQQQLTAAGIKALQQQVERDG